MLRRICISAALLGLLAIAVLPSGCGPAQDSARDSAGSERVTVLAAASLTDALSEIGEAWRARGGAVQFSFASSSVLARQIEAGAPADVFMSADLQWMDYLAARWLIDPASRIAPIGNRLVLIAPPDSPLDTVIVDGALDLGALLGAEGRLVVGDPGHVPAGRYAREALTALGLWEDAAPRLARADNVRAALALVERGEAGLGAVYGTDAAAGAVKTVGAFPAGSHAPVIYPFALTVDGPVDGQGDKRGNTARDFLAFAAGPEGLAIFESHGFTVTQGFSVTQ